MSILFHPYLSKSTSSGEFTIYKEFENNGRVEIHSEVDKNQNDYRDLLLISFEFAKIGRKVQILPKLHFKDKRYKKIFGGLIGTKYDGKCPDLKVDDDFFEYEGFISDNPKTNFSNMLRRGLKQSSRIIIKDCNMTLTILKELVFKELKRGM